jgi:hypothetical protein
LRKAKRVVRTNKDQRNGKSELAQVPVLRAADKKPWFQSGAGGFGIHLVNRTLKHRKTARKARVSRNHFVACDRAGQETQME